MRIRFEKSVRTYIEERTWHPSQQIRPAPRGAIELEMQVGDTAELRSWILSFGGDARVEEPDSLRDEIAAELKRATGRYAKARSTREA